MPDPTTKPCSRCGEIKPLDGFHRQRRRPQPPAFGRQSQCKLCRDIVRIALRENDPTRHAARAPILAARRALWRSEHPEGERAMRARYHALHGEQRRARNTAWKAAHPDEVIEHRAQRRARELNAFVAPVNRRAIYERDGGKCRICGKPVSLRRMQIDHIIPLARGGTHEPKNVQVAHKVCNQRKFTTGVGQPRLLE